MKLLIAFFLICLFTAPLLAETGADKLARLAAPMIISVRGEAKGGKTSTASGVLISPKGYFVCTAHAITGAKKIFVKAMGWNQERAAKFILQDEGSRLVLMKIDGPLIKDLPYMKLNCTTTPPAGSNYLLLSFAHGKSGIQGGTGTFGSLFEPLKEYDLTGKELYSFEAIKLLKQFPALCTGGPVLNEKAQLVGIASYLFGKTKGSDKASALCYVIPTKWIYGFCAAAADPKLVNLHGKKMTGLQQTLTATEAELDLKGKINFRRTKTLLIERLVTIVKKGKEQRKLLNEAKFAKMSRKAQAIHKRHKEWAPEVVEFICKRELKAGMTKAMIKEMFGKPKFKKNKTHEGKYFEEWGYHNRGAFGSISKARSLVFNSDGKLIHKEHYRGNLYVK